jgi:hypothetical protein
MLFGQKRIADLDRLDTTAAARGPASEQANCKRGEKADEKDLCHKHTETAEDEDEQEHYE